MMSPHTPVVNPDRRLHFVSFADKLVIPLVKWLASTKNEAEKQRTSVFDAVHLKDRKLQNHAMKRYCGLARCIVDLRTL